MYPVTNTVRDLFWSGARQVVKITFQGSGETITLTEADVMQGGLTIDRYSVSGNKIEIGSAVAAELSLKLDNLDGRFSDVAFEGAELYVQIGIRDWTAAGNTINWVPCGYFIVDEPPRTLSVINLKALDRMVKFDRVVDPAQLTFPMTVEALIQRCCALCDVTLYSGLSGLPNRAYSITAFPETGGGEVTYRTLIQWCAALLGTCAFIRWDGLLTFQWYTATGLTLAPAQRYSSDLLENDITLTGVVFQDAEETRYTAGTDDYALDLTGNGLVQGTPQTVVNALSAVLRGFTYRPYTAEVKSSPFLWPMDKITYTDGDGNTHPAVVTNVTYLMNGSTGLAGVGETTQRNGYASTGALTKQQATVLERLRKLVDTDVGERALAAIQLNETIANSLGLYQTSIAESDGSTSYYFHDGVTLAGSTVIYTFKAGGFAWTDDWNGGNPVWNYGITRQGNALLNILTVYKLTADYIYGGTLTLGGQGNGNGVLVLMNANGNEIGRMDNDGLVTSNANLSGLFRCSLNGKWYNHSTGEYVNCVFISEFEGGTTRLYRDDTVIGYISPNHSAGEEIVHDRIEVNEYTGLSNMHICAGSKLSLGIMWDKNGTPTRVTNDREAIKLTLEPTSTYYHTRVEVTGKLYYNNLTGSGVLEVATVSSSSKRYKHSISYELDEGLDVHRLYDLKAVQFVYNEGHPLQYADMAGRLLPGFIAEDVAKIYPAAAIRNEKGEIESWDERRVLPGVLALVQEQREEISRLQERVSKLENLLLKGED